MGIKLNTETEKTLIRVAEMYYMEDKNQSEISKELNIHRSTISRLLKQSRESGIVDIKINYSSHFSLQKELEEYFDFLTVIIYPKSNTSQTIESFSADYISDILFDGAKVGLSWGSTLSSISTTIRPSNFSNITFIPLIGGPSGVLSSEYHVNTITNNFAKNVVGKAILIDAPALPDTVELKNALMSTKYNSFILSQWSDLDIAIFGIGSWKLSKSAIWQAFYSKEVINKLHEKNVVGDVVSRFYDKNGTHIDNALDDRIIGINLNNLNKIPLRIGVAHSIEKAEAILGAIKGKYLNTLITSEETVVEILRLLKKKPKASV